MRALVLGGAGFIGLHLTRRLVECGHDVTVVDDFSRGRADLELSQAGVPVLDVDLTRRAGFDQVPQGWDQVFLLAAVVGVRNVESDPSRVLRVNSLTVLNTLDWIEPGTRLFFASTSEVYDGAAQAAIISVPTSEYVPLLLPDLAAPRSSYAMSKAFGEAAVLHALRARDLPCTVGRFHNVYGPRMGAAHVIPEMTLRALRGEDPFPVYGSDQSRAFCYIDDAVEAVVRLMGCDAASGEVVNIGNDTETNVADLAARILHIAGASPEIALLPAPPGSVPRRCPDLTKLRRLTGFEPTVPLDEGLRRTFDWYADTLAHRASEAAALPMG